MWLPVALKAQTDIFPSSVDIRLVQGATSDQLKVQLKTHSTAPFGGILSAVTVTIRYDAASGASLGAGNSFCSAWSNFPPSPVVVDNGIAYRTFNGFGTNRLENSSFDGGCDTTIAPEEWFTITTIPVIGACTGFTLGNDAWTAQNNRNYYLSMGGFNLTGQVVGGPVNAGACGTDCTGVPGGPALPGTPCDDGNPNTSGDTWTSDCQCIGTGCTAPVITATSSDAPICAGSTLSLGATAIGTGPLSYAWTGPGSFSPNANVANVTVTGATSGSYQVTVSNTCGSASSSLSVVVNPVPNATISYAGSPYCSSAGVAQVSRTGTGGGSFSASPSGLSLNAGNGNINLGGSTAGTYTVTYAIAAAGGCSAFSTTAQVVVTAAPNATISYAGSPYCSSAGVAQVSRTGTGSGAYSASPSGLSLNAGNGNINLGGSTAGTYTVTYSIAAAGGCSAFSTTAQVVVTAAPNAMISYAGTPYCSSAGVAQVSRTGAGGGAYSASPTGLSLNAGNGNINLGGSTAGTYTVTYTIAAAGGCSAFSTTAQVVVTAAPNATISYAGSPYCSSAGVAQVSRTGTGGGSFSASPSGLSLNAGNGNIHPNNSTPGSYTVTYAIPASGGCPAFSTSSQVVVTAAPTATISYPGSPYCGTTGTATVARTGQGGGSYSASPAGLAINAGTGTINLGNSNAGQYTVSYSIAAGGGCSSFTTTAAVTINAPSTWYADVDGDQMGDNSAAIQACSQPPGYVAIGGDLCPDDPDKVAPGTCGCGMADIDSDKDGIADCIDSCPLLEGQVGDPCDDGDPGTESDTITVECTCAGISTGVEEPADGMVNWTIYPNPNHTGTVVLDLSGFAVGKEVDVEVRDLAGRLVYKEHFRTGAVDRLHTMNMSPLPSIGMYVVVLKFMDHSFLKKLVIH
jgi:hypothetical protein